MADDGDTGVTGRLGRGRSFVDDAQGSGIETRAIPSEVDDEVLVERRGSSWGRSRSGNRSDELSQGMFEGATARSDIGQLEGFFFLLVFSD